MLPAVVTVQEAMRDDAPILHDHMRTLELGEQTDRVSNVSEHTQYVLGDLDKGLAEADVVIEREYDTAMVHQGYIEPQNATAFWNKDGKVTIWSSTQGPFQIRDATATLLDLDVGDVRLVPMEIGGGFGGKLDPFGAPVAAMLSKKTGRPVKVVMDRAEDLQSTAPTPGSNMRVKVGATREGKITAAYAYLALEAGAFPGSLVIGAAWSVFSAYDIPNLVIDGYDVVLNRPKTGAYRAPGATHAAFAMEAVVDELAERLGIDPIELRLMNAAREGTRLPYGPINPRIGCVEVLEAMRDHPHYSAPIEGDNKGRGASGGVLDERHRGGGMHSPGEPRRKSDSQRRLGRHWRLQGGGRHARRGSPRSASREHQPPGRGHRLHRLHGGHGGQQHGLQDGLGCLRGCPRRQAPDDRAGGKDYGRSIPTRLT